MKLIYAKDRLAILPVDELMLLDIWQAEQVGLKPDTVNGSYQLNFTDLEPLWFKSAVKKFIRFQAATRSYASCSSYLGRLKHFGEFLMQEHPNITANQVNRSLMINYLIFLSKKQLSTVTRSMALVHLRTFHNIMLQEKWLSWPKELLIYSSDLPKPSQSIPRFIPEIIISQLQQHLHHLPLFMQHLITILLETGRRVGEICTLPLHCLEQDEQGDYFLKVKESKIKNSAASDRVLEKI